MIQNTINFLTINNQEIISMKNNFKLLMNNNSKMKKANKLNDGANTFEFCLPDAKSKSGDTICFGAGECLEFCYIFC